MARKETLVIRSLVDSAIEIGIVNGVQAFAAKMAPMVLRIEREGKLNELQIALALGWDGAFIYGNRIDRKRFAKIIFERLQRALIADANPGSDLARHEREKQLGLF
jgi:hypothetical protein